MIMSLQPYNTYYAEKLEKGLEFEDFVSSLFFEMGIAFVRYSSRRYQFEHGENSAGIEIKFDDRLKETGNLYIEVAEKSHPGNAHFIASGIYRMDNGWLYAIGNYKVVYVFLTRHLRWMYERGQLTKKETSTSQGFLLPERLARKYAARVLKPPSDVPDNFFAVLIGPNPK
jgi:hypothetical protein